MRDLARLAAIVAIGSALVHVTLAAETMSRSLLTGGLLAVMGGLCLACLPGLWRGGSVHAWMTMLGLTGVMLYAHLGLCFDCGPSVHDAADLRLGLADRLLGQGLSSLALWLMLAETALASFAVLRLLFRPTLNHPEVVQP